MPPNIETAIEGINFRVLIEPAGDGIYIARCLQTGTVAVGVTVEEAEMLIKAILENDFRRAIELGSVAGLLSQPAEFDVRDALVQTKAADPDGVRQIPLAVTDGSLKNRRLSTIGKPTSRPTLEP
jgi:predicted RNase H-like HicB family nuclease